MGLCLNLICPHYCGVEDMQHLFKGCYKAKEVWLALCGRNWYIDMTRHTWQVWLLSNSKNKSHFNDHATWSSVFIVTLWKIWKNMNSFVFDNISLNCNDSLKFIHDYSRDIDWAFKASIINPRPAFKLIHWVLPSVGKLKLNVDGSRRLAGGGGFCRVFRDEIGSWVCGYYGKMDSGTSLETELWALYKGLTVILQKGMHGVVIETNAQQVVQLMEEDKMPRSSSGVVNATIQHVFKERYLCADILAKLGAEQPEDILVVNDPPAKIRSSLVTDMIGLSRERA
ncbi:hypothetical protein ACSBR2_036497 [Camellia fascicularis]